MLWPCSRSVGKAQWGAGKKDLAVTTWKEGQKNCTDVYLFAEFDACIKGDVIRSTTFGVPAVASTRAVQASGKLQGDILIYNSPVQEPSFGTPVQTSPAAVKRSIIPAVTQAGEADKVPTELGEISGEQFETLANAAMGKIIHGVGDAKVDKMIGMSDGDLVNIK